MERREGGAGEIRKRERGTLSRRAVNAFALESAANRAKRLHDEAENELSPDTRCLSMTSRVVSLARAEG